MAKTWMRSALARDHVEYRWRRLTLMDQGALFDGCHQYLRQRDALPEKEARLIVIQVRQGRSLLRPQAADANPRWGQTSRRRGAGRSW